MLDCRAIKQPINEKTNPLGLVFFVEGSGKVSWLSIQR